MSCSERPRPKPVAVTKTPQPREVRSNSQPGRMWAKGTDAHLGASPMNLIVNAGRRGDSTKSRLAAHNIVVHAPCRPGRGSDATRPRATEHRGRCLVDLPATQ